jgi:hypothetical protein
MQEKKCDVAWVCRGFIFKSQMSLRYCRHDVVAYLYEPRTLQLTAPMWDLGSSSAWRHTSKVELVIRVQKT